MEGTGASEGATREEQGRAAGDEGRAAHLGGQVVLPGRAGLWGRDVDHGLGQPDDRCHGLVPGAAHTRRLTRARRELLHHVAVELSERDRAALVQICTTLESLGDEFAEECGICGLALRAVGVREREVLARDVRGCGADGGRAVEPIVVEELRGLCHRGVEEEHELGSVEPERARELIEAHGRLADLLGCSGRVLGEEHRVTEVATDPEPDVEHEDGVAFLSLLPDLGRVGQDVRARGLFGVAREGHALGAEGLVERQGALGTQGLGLRAPEPRDVLEVRGPDEQGIGFRFVLTLGRHSILGASEREQQTQNDDEVHDSLRGDGVEMGSW